MTKIGKFIGIPYQDWGRDYNGCDCYGLVYLFYRDYLNIELPSYSYNSKEHKPNTISNIINKHKKELFKQVKEPNFGDCIIFNVYGNSTHIGIFLDNNQFLHNTELRRFSCIDRLNHIFWKSRIEGFYAYNNI